MWACKINLELLYSSHFNSRFLFYIILPFLFFITFPFLLFSLFSISSFRVHLLQNLSFIAFHILLPYLLFIYFLSNLRFICFLSFFVVYILPFLFAIRKIPLCLHRSSLQLKVSYTSFFFVVLYKPVDVFPSLFIGPIDQQQKVIYKRFTFQRNKLGEKHWEPWLEGPPGSHLLLS